jgi:hypothetical protein
LLRHERPLIRDRKTDIKRIVARTRPECRTFAARGRAHSLHIPTRGREDNVRRCVEVALELPVEVGTVHTTQALKQIPFLHHVRYQDLKVCDDGILLRFLCFWMLLIFVFLFQTHNVSEIGTSSIEWAQLSRFHLKTETEPSSETLCVSNKNMTMDNNQKHSNCMSVIIVNPLNAEKPSPISRVETLLTSAPNMITGLCVTVLPTLLLLNS